MSKRRLLCIVVLAVLLSLSFARPAYAYMDPGTTGSIFGMLAPFIAIALAFIGFLIRPIKVFFISIFAKLRGNRRNESQASERQPESVDSTDDEESRECTGE